MGMRHTTTLTSSCRTVIGSETPHSFILFRMSYCFFNFAHLLARTLSVVCVFEAQAFGMAFLRALTY
jgi:hypothetical protein